MDMKRITSYKEVTLSLRFSKDFTDNEISMILDTDLSDFKNHKKIITDQLNKLNFPFSYSIEEHFYGKKGNRNRIIVYIEKNSAK